MTSTILSASLAFAQGQPGGQGPSGPLQILASPLVMMGIIFAIIYFLIMRPQQKKQREHQLMLRNLKKRLPCRAECLVVWAVWAE